MKLVNTDVIKTQPKALWFLIVAYTVLVLFSTWFIPFQVDIMGIHSNTGEITFSLTFLISSLITEVYGYKNARQAIWAAFLLNNLISLYGQIISHFPVSSYPAGNSLFNWLLVRKSWLLVGGGGIYLLDAFINCYIVATLKLKMQGRYMTVRLILSLVLTIGISGLLYAALLSYDYIYGEYFQGLVLILLTHLCVCLLGLIILVPVAHRLKKIECLDIYDNHTRFTVFSLESRYSVKNNKFSGGS